MGIQIKNIINAIEAFAPVSFQESWDNSGLIVGDANAEVDAALIALDVTLAVVEEAIENGCGLIIAHHPIIFSGLKKITGRNDVERSVIKAIRHNVAIYAAHTNIDVVWNGVSHRMAQKLSLHNIKVLAPQKGLLKKLVVFVPEAHAEKVRNAMFEAGAGQIGNYGNCSFNVGGAGSFKANEQAKPFAGEIGQLHFEDEVRIETVVPAHLQQKVIAAMLGAHPYEEVAYDVYSLENAHAQIGLGVLAETEKPVDVVEFLMKVKQAFGCDVLKHTIPHGKTISKVALCGGSGSMLINDAKRAGADIFITADIKYHQFFEAENQIIIADIGHFESEQFTKELFFEIVTNKFPKFALRLSQVQTNPVKYLF